MITPFHMAWRSLFRKGRHNGIKILALSIGLALGVILSAQRSGQGRNVIGQPIPMECASTIPLSGPMSLPGSPVVRGNIATCIALRSQHIANEEPVNSLKIEQSLTF